MSRTHIETTTTKASSAATTNATLVKAGLTNLSYISINNASAATKFVRFYNKATAPTVGTDTPAMVISVPATSSKEIALPVPVRFGLGLGYAITGAAAVLDATAVALNDVQVLLSTF